jgi:glycosyltransferase involved in cell wall biosynthesis
MARASVYVLSSRFEGMPMVVIEALSKGLPVVAFDCPTGPGEMIDHGRDGLLVPPGDVPGLTAALSTLIEDRAMRDRLGERAIAASRAYDLDRVGPLWLRLLDELSPDGGPPRRLPARRVVVAACAFLGLALGALGFFGLDV